MILYNYLLVVLAVAVILPSTPALLLSPFFRLETAHKKNISIRFHISLHMQTKLNLYISCYHFYMHTHARTHTHTNTHTHTQSDTHTHCRTHTHSRTHTHTHPQFESLIKNTKENSVTLPCVSPSCSSSRGCLPTRMFSFFFLQA